MNRRISHYPAVQILADEAAELVRPHMWLDYTGSLAQPDIFDAALAARAADLHDVRIRSCLSFAPRAILEADPDCRHFQWFNWHFSGYDRAKHDCGLCNYIPLNLGEVPDYYRRFLDPVDIVVLKACPIGEDGYLDFFGPTNLWLRAIVECAKTVIVEVTKAIEG